MGGDVGRFVIRNGLDALPHASGVRVALKVLLDPQLVAVPGRFDAPLQVSPG